MIFKQHYVTHSLEPISAVFLIPSLAFILMQFFSAIKFFLSLWKQLRFFLWFLHWKNLELFFLFIKLIFLIAPHRWMLTFVYEPDFFFFFIFRRWMHKIISFQKCHNKYLDCLNCHPLHLTVANWIIYFGVWRIHFNEGKLVNLIVWKLSIILI